MEETEKLKSVQKDINALIAKYERDLSLGPIVGYLESLDNNIGSRIDFLASDEIKRAERRGAARAGRGA